MGKNDLKSLVKEINRLSLKKGDILIFKIPRKVSPAIIERMQVYVKAVMKEAGLSGVPFLALSDEVDIKIVSKEEV